MNNYDFAKFKQALGIPALEPPVPNGRFTVVEMEITKLSGILNLSGEHPRLMGAHTLNPHGQIVRSFTAGPGAIGAALEWAEFCNDRFIDNWKK